MYYELYFSLQEKRQTLCFMAGSKDPESFLYGGSGGRLETQQLAHYELELLRVVGWEGGDLPVVVLDRSTVPANMHRYKARSSQVVLKDYRLE